MMDAGGGRRREPVRLGRVLVAGVCLLLLGARPGGVALLAAAELTGPVMEGGGLENKVEVKSEVLTVLSKDDQDLALHMPGPLFFDRRADELYVVNNRGQSRLVVYGPDFFPQESLGGERGLDSPTGGYCDAEGNLYLLQTASAGKPARVTVLNQAFRLIREIALAGMPEVGDFSPQRLVRGKEGKLYIVGAESRRVLILAADGSFGSWFEVPVAKDWSYQAGNPAKADSKASIRNVQVDSQGNLFFLSEETSKTYVFDSQERFLFAFGSKGGSEGKLSRPRALAIDEQKKCIYVIDYMRHTMLGFDMNGAFRFEVGGQGWGPGWFNYPSDVVLGRQGQVIVADLFNQRVQVLQVTTPELPEREPGLWTAKAEGKAEGEG